ncbi:MAG: PucR family transcriptional regulator [Propionibacteriaceae bacterium]
MEKRHDWFRDLDADHRSWITLVARGGIDGFVTWFQGGDVSPVSIFNAAPRIVMRRVSLAQTVELVRTTIDVFESQAKLVVANDDIPVIEKAILLYSREVAFAAASVYAKAAEVRGGWDARLEALVVDAIVRNDTDETVISRASTLGWQSAENVVVVIGELTDIEALDDARNRAQRLKLDSLVAAQGDRLVLILGGEQITDAGTAHQVVTTSFVDLFGPGPLVLGPVVEHLADASISAKAAIEGLRACPAWPHAPRPINTANLLPERVLVGDNYAREELISQVYTPLQQAGGDLLLTCSAFLDHYGSVEGTSRALFVHANTVRYRLKRIYEVTGYSATNARDAHALRMAISLGHLADHERRSYISSH